MEIKRGKEGEKDKTHTQRLGEGDGETDRERQSDRVRKTEKQTKKERVRGT